MRLHPLATALLMTLLLAACGRGQGDAPAGPDPADGTQAAADAATDADQ